MQGDVPRVITICFRLDDPSHSSDHVLEAHIVDIFARHGARLTVAAIPFDDRSEHLQPFARMQARHLIEAKAAGIVEIAQHGHRHLDRQCGGRRGPSEFVGLPQMEQRDRVLEGRAVLNDLFGQDVVGFVPPFNSFDGATMRVLAGLGFGYLSAGWEFPDDAEGVLAFVPRTVQVARFNSALVEARRFDWHSPVIVVVLHHYDFEESGSAEASINLARFDDLLRRALGQPSVAIAPIAAVSRDFAGGVGLCCARRMSLRSRHWRLSSILPGSCLVPGHLGAVAATGLFVRPQ